MADPQKPTIASVSAFVAELKPPTVAAVLEKKFAGRKTWRTIQASQRIAKKKKKAKIPRNLLRQLWRVTGGWNEKNIFQARNAYKGFRAGKYNFGVLPLGDAEVRFYQSQSNAPIALVLFRGRVFARLGSTDESLQSDEWNSKCWLDPERVIALHASLPVQEIELK